MLYARQLHQLLGRGRRLRIQQKMDERDIIFCQLPFLLLSPLFVVLP